MSEVKVLATKKEWSFAEACRRGLELLVDRYPSEIEAVESDWVVPPAIKGGWKVTSDEELNRLRFEDQEPEVKCL